MEVHQHTHTARKKWTHYFWEFLMLFLAVFAGFLAENEREHYIEHRRAKDFATALTRDLEKDTLQIKRWIRYHEIYVDIVDSLTEIAIKYKAEDMPKGKFYFYARFASWHRALPWSRTSIEQIKSSGSLRYFRNFTLQEKITSYDTKVREHIAYFEQQSPASIKCLDLSNQILDTRYYAELSKIFLPGLDSLPRNYIDSLLNMRPPSLKNQQEKIKELVNMSLVRRRTFLIQSQRDFPEMLQLAKELIITLKKEYNLK